MELKLITKNNNAQLNSLKDLERQLELIKLENLEFKKSIVELNKVMTTKDDENKNQKEALKQKCAT